MEDIRRKAGTLLVDLRDETDGLWTLVFKTIQAWKVTTEECAGMIVATLPPNGALFMVEESPWVKQLGDSSILNKSKHYVVSCYDEVLEVLAWDCEIQKRDH